MWSSENVKNVIKELVYVSNLKQGKTFIKKRQEKRGKKKNHQIASKVTINVTLTITWSLLFILLKETSALDASSAPFPN